MGFLQWCPWSRSLIGSARSLGAGQKIPLPPARAGPMPNPPSEFQPHPKFGPHWQEGAWVNGPPSDPSPPVSGLVRGSGHPALQLGTRGSTASSASGCREHRKIRKGTMSVPGGGQGCGRGKSNLGSWLANLSFPHVCYKDPRPAKSRAGWLHPGAIPASATGLAWSHSQTDVC